MKKHDRTALTPQDISGFCAQVALMLGSGMALYDGMETLAASYRGHPQEQMFVRVSQAVTETGSLAEALQQDAAWPAYMREMTAIGERTGRLEEIMNSLSAYYDQESRLRQTIVSAVTYPVVLGLMMAIIVAVLILKVMPVFRRVLSSMGIALTASGSTLMQLGATIGWAVFAAVLLLLLAIALCLLLMRTGKKDQVLAFLQKMIPALKKISLRISAARISGVMSMMLASGFPMEEALHAIPALLTDQGAIAQLKLITDKMQNGDSFESAIDGSELFDEIHNRMIRLGIQAGRGDQVMEKIASLYEEQAVDSINSLISIIEPTLVALLSIVIGAVLLSVMLPMAGMISSMV